MKKIIAIVLVIIGIVGGGAAGMFLKPAPEADPESEAKDAENESTDGKGDESAEAGAEDGVDTAPASFVKIGRQTIVPVLDEGQTKALMLFELAIDVSAEANDRALEMEPRLRDAFLRELFQMSYTGAFEEAFTDERVIDELRQNLVRAARKHLGKKAVKDVLILDVMRQEM